MNAIDKKWWAALGLLVGATLPDARAQEPPSSAAASANPPAPVLRSLVDTPPPSERTDVPKPDEWNNAEQVALIGELPKACKAKLLREWLQIHCEENGGAFMVISGSRDDVSASLKPIQFPPSGSPITGSSTIQLPLRRGDRRVMQLIVMSFNDYGGNVWPSSEFILSEQWLEDQTGPWVTVQ